MEQLMMPFELVAPDVDETPRPGEMPRDLALRLSRQKAQAVAQLRPEAVVIGSDQVLDFNGECLGKPGDHANAVAMLTRLSGQTVKFETAVTVCCQASGFSVTDIATIHVVFRQLSAHEIERYLRKDTPYDCAGSAKSESLGIALLERIDSDDPTALVGLPMIRTARMLREAGLALI
jgi:septum formation protein